MLNVTFRAANLLVSFIIAVVYSHLWCLTTLIVSNKNLQQGRGVTVGSVTIFDDSMFLSGWSEMEKLG